MKKHLKEKYRFNWQQESSEDESDEEEREETPKTEEPRETTEMDDEVRPGPSTDAFAEQNVEITISKSRRNRCRNNDVDHEQQNTNKRRYSHATKKVVLASQTNRGKRQYQNRRKRKHHQRKSNRRAYRNRN